ncbi:MAG: hypothetical protein ABWY54_05155 [Glaciihabitans sp.]
MSASIVFALGFALVASLCLLAHTIVRQPTTAAAPAHEKRTRFPIVSSEKVITARDFPASDKQGRVDDAYLTWVRDLNDSDSNAGHLSTSSC